MSVNAHTDRHQFGWLLGNFVHQTDGVREASRSPPTDC